MHILKKQFFTDTQRWLVFYMSISLVLTLTAVFLKYYLNLYNALDLAIFNHAFFQTVSGYFFNSSINPPSYFGDHFAPLLLALVPFYYLIPHPLTLLTIQTFVLVCSAIPLYKITARLLSDRWTKIIIASWLASPFLGSVALFEFHTLAFVPLLFFTLWNAFVTNNKKIFTITLLLLLLVREDIGFLLFGLGLVLLWHARLTKVSFRYGIVTILLSLIWTPLALKIVNAFSLEGSYKFYAYYGWLGTAPQDMFVNILTHPAAILEHLFTTDTLALFFILLLPVLYLSVFAAGYLLAFAPPLTALLLTTEGGTPLIPFLHYSAWLLPPVYLSVVYAIRRIKNNPNTKLTRILHRQQTLLKLSFITSIVFFFIFLHPVAYVLYKATTDSTLRLNRQTLLPLYASIEPDDTIVTTGEFLTDFSSRKNIHYLRYLYSDRYQLSETPYSFPDDIQYMLFRPSDLMYYDFLTTGLAPDSVDDGTKLNTYIYDKKLVPFIIVKDYILWKPNVHDFYEYYSTPEKMPATAHIITTTSSNALQLKGWDIGNKTEDHIILTLYYTKVKDTDPIFFQVNLLENKEVIDRTVLPSSFGLVTTDTWPIDSLVATRLLIPYEKSVRKQLTHLELTPVHIKATYTLDRFASGLFTLDELTTAGDTTIIPLQ